MKNANVSTGSASSSRIIRVCSSSVNRFAAVRSFRRFTLLVLRKFTSARTVTKAATITTVLSPYRPLRVVTKAAITPRARTRNPMNAPRPAHSKASAHPCSSGMTP